MKIARFLWRGRVRWGDIRGDEIWTVGRNVLRDPLESSSRYLCPLSEIRLLAPIDTRESKVVAIAANYGERDERDGPGIFMKQPGTVIGPDEPIVYPRIGRNIIHEAELGIVIGRAARHVSVENALEYVMGYTCVNDVSASELESSDLGRGTSMRWKHFDTFCPIGPWIVSADEIYRTDRTHPTHFDIRCRVNGETVVEGSTRDMLWGIAELVSWVSEVMALHPGDIIASGCPDVGEIAVGDTVEVAVDHIGTLRNFVVADA